MVTASRPSASAMAMAASTSASRLSRGLGGARRGRRGAEVASFTTVIVQRRGDVVRCCTTYMYNVQEEIAVPSIHRLAPPLRPLRQVSPWLVLAVLALAQFIDTLDVTIVNVALP